MVVAFAANRSCCSARSSVTGNSFQEGERQKLEPYQERIEHAKMCHVQ